jgi:hypothetical protein
LLTFKTTVHEDNQGALKLAKLEHGSNTPRSKFCAVKYNWFRSWLKPKEIEIMYIESSSQKADMLTKSLPVIAFERKRKLSFGWLPLVREGETGGFDSLDLEIQHVSFLS